MQRRAEEYVAELLLPRMRKKHPDANIKIKRRSFVPGIKPEENEEAAKLALQWTGGNRTYAVPYGTEAGIFRSHGIPTVICGPAISPRPTSPTSSSPNHRWAPAMPSSTR